MREIVLSPSFVQRIQELNTIRDREETLDTVWTFAGALDMMHCNMAEDMIYHGLVTSSLAGRQLDQEELVASLNELWRIRAEKVDGFAKSPTAKWRHLTKVRAYKTLEKRLEPIEMGLVLHTISDYLENNPDEVAEEVRQMESFEETVKELSECRDADTIYRLFDSELIGICSAFVGREEYLLACADSYDMGKFEIAFARLFIKMAKDFLKPKKSNYNTI